MDLPSIQDFDDLIQAINSCDLVISIEGIVPHIAGALNIKTWLLLPSVPKHTWDLNFKTSSPWYPSIEVFRQKKYGDWGNVISEVKSRVNNV